MHHVTLDRARADDGDLDDQVVEFGRFEPRQHRHLRPAFDLEYADRVGAVCHLIGTLVLLRDGGKSQVHAVVLAEQVEASADAAQHAESKHIDFEDAQLVQVILVPLDDGSIFHRRIRYGQQMVEPVAGDDEAADMLAQMTREAIEGRRHLQYHRHGGVVRVYADGPNAVWIEVAGSPAPVQAAQHLDGVLGQTEDLADVADGAFGAICDVVGGEGCPVPAVLLVDVLHHLFAALVLEVHVDVRWLVALGGDEAFEQ